MVSLVCHTRTLEEKMAMYCTTQLIICERNNCRSVVFKWLLCLVSSPGIFCQVHEYTHNDTPDFQLLLTLQHKLLSLVLTTIKGKIYTYETIQGGAWIFVKKHCECSGNLAIPDTEEKNVQLIAAV